MYATNSLSLNGRGLGRGCLPHKNIKLAKALRTSQTDAEMRIWQALRASRLLSYKFRRQVPIGNFIVDFVCFEKKLIVEIDGGQHLDSKTDLTRDVKLKAQDYRVLRFWNNEITENLDGVLVVILQYLQMDSPLPSPLPQGARELNG
jgi:very-short-patch-repair endonuclease